MSEVESLDFFRDGQLVNDPYRGTWRRCAASAPCTASRTTMSSW
jgi:hypothetical protein